MTSRVSVKIRFVIYQIQAYIIFSLSRRSYYYMLTYTSFVFWGLEVYQIKDCYSILLYKKLPSKYPTQNSTTDVYIHLYQRRPVWSTFKIGTKSEVYRYTRFHPWGLHLYAVGFLYISLDIRDLHVYPNKRKHGIHVTWTKDPPYT